MALFLAAAADFSFWGPSNQLESLRTANVAISDNVAIYLTVCLCPERDLFVQLSNSEPNQHHQLLFFYLNVRSVVILVTHIDRGLMNWKSLGNKNWGLNQFNLSFSFNLIEIKMVMFCSLDNFGGKKGVFTPNIASLCSYHHWTFLLGNVTFMQA